MSRPYFLFFNFLAIFIFTLANGQKPTTEWATRCEDTEAMFMAEVMPKYPGGTEFFIADLKSNIKLSSGTNTEFRLQFGINCKGEIYRLNFLDSSLSKENRALFIRGFKKLKTWVPAKHKHKHKPIDSLFSLKIYIENGQISRPKKK